MFRFDVLHERDRRTDRQTDGQTVDDSKDRACIASRGKNDGRPMTWKDDEHNRWVHRRNTGTTVFLKRGFSLRQQLYNPWYNHTGSRRSRSLYFPAQYFPTLWLAGA